MHIYEKLLLRTTVRGFYERKVIIQYKKNNKKSGYKRKNYPTLFIFLSFILLSLLILLKLLCLLVKHDALQLPCLTNCFAVALQIFVLSSYLEYQGSRSEKIFYRQLIHRTANTVQLDVTIKEYFSDLFFFPRSRSEGNSSETS